MWRKGRKRLFHDLKHDTESTKNKKQTANEQLPHTGTKSTDPDVPGRAESRGDKGDRNKGRPRKAQLCHPKEGTHTVSHGYNSSRGCFPTSGTEKGNSEALSSR